MAMTPEDRRAVIGCVFASACILFAPGEFRAGGFLVFVTLVLAGRHVVLSRREALAKPAAPAPPAPEPPPPEPAPVDPLPIEPLLREPVPPDGDGPAERT